MTNCTGDRNCAAPIHIHGCFADRGNCDNQADHHENFAPDFSMPSDFAPNQGSPMTTDSVPAHNEPVSLKDLRLTPRDLLLMAWLNQRGVTAEAEEEFEQVLSSLLSTARADGWDEGVMVADIWHTTPMEKRPLRFPANPHRNILSAIPERTVVPLTTEEPK